MKTQTKNLDIEVINLKKEFVSGKEKTIAVDNLSFSVKKGEIFGLLGPNGAGKSTTINMIVGLIRPDSGKILILGKDPEKDWEYVKNRCNVSTAYFEMLTRLTVKQNLMFYAKVYNIKSPEKQIKRLLKLFEIEHLENKRIGGLSSGENTRVLLCKGLVNDPEVLFLDECTVGLDPDIADKTRKAIMKYHKDTGCTILFTSHYMPEVEELCNRIAFMDKGKIFKIDTAENLKKSITISVIEITLKTQVKELVSLLKSNDAKILSIEGKKVIFEADSVDDQVYKILNKIFAGGFMLDDLEIKKPTLEDIFINIARKNKK